MIVKRDSDVALNTVLTDAFHSGAHGEPLIVDGVRGRSEESRAGQVDDDLTHKVIESDAVPVPHLNDEYRTTKWSFDTWFWQEIPIVLILENSGF